MDIDPSKIFVVSVMPCTAKKFEVERPELSSGGYPDVDVSITTREAARMIMEAGIDFNSLPDEEFDDPMERPQEQGLYLVQQAALWKLH